MVVDFTRAPFPITYRELLLPRGIRENTVLHRSRYDGHDLALTGTRKGTTANMGFRQHTAGSYLDLGGIHDGATPWWISFRFKLHADHLAGGGSPSEYLVCKDGSGGFWLSLQANDNLLLVDLPGAGQFGRRQDYFADTWYHVFYSLGQTIVGGAASDGQRLRVNLSIATNALTAALPGAGSLVIANNATGGANNGAGCVIEDIVIGTDIVTEDEEEDLYNGIPPADAVNCYPLDEGRGDIVYDRGSGGNNGSKGTVASWNFGQCKQPVLSFDGINDIGETAASVVNISGDLTIVWAGKTKCTYHNLAIGDHYLWEFQADANNFIMLWYNLLGNDIRYMTKGGEGAAAYCDFAFTPNIDDYAILICTLNSDRMVGYLNGYLNTQQLVVSDPIVGLATGYIGAEDSPAYYDPSKPLAIAIIDGAFTQKQVLSYSRWLNEILHMGIAI